MSRSTACLARLRFLGRRDGGFVSVRHHRSVRGFRRLGELDVQLGRQASCVHEPARRGGGAEQPK